MHMVYSRPQSLQKKIFDSLLQRLWERGWKEGCGDSERTVDENGYVPGNQKTWILDFISNFL